MKNTISNNLIDFIKQIPKENIFLSSSELTISYGDLVDYTNEMFNKFEEFKNKNIAVSFEKRWDGCVNLPFLAMLSNNIFLQPEGLARELLVEFYEKSEIDYVVNISKSEIVFNKVVNSNSFDMKKSKQWIIATSGTSGNPKLATFSLDRLSETTKKSLTNGENVVWGLVYDLCRFAGVQLYLQAIISGATLTVSENTEEIDSIINNFFLQKVNSLSGTPSFYRKLLMSPLVDSLMLKRITLGGEIADQFILDALSRKFPSARIVHIYASTELGVGFSVKDKREGFPISYLEIYNLKIKNDNLWIKAKRNSTDMIKGQIEIDEEGYCNTEDLVKIEEDRIIFLGRLSGAINVGGNKVIPEEIEAVLSSSGFISGSLVYGKKNGIMGMIVFAEVILLPEYQNDINVKKNILDFCRSHLEPFKVPAIVKIVDSIELNTVGKKIRRV